MSNRPTTELVWPGKYDEAGERAAVPRSRPQPTALEVHGHQSPNAGWHNELVIGDNLLGLDALLCNHAGAVDLVYLDPPFMTGGDFEVSTRVGGSAKNGASARELKAPAYSDVWQGGLGAFLAMLDPRLRLIHELLAPNGSLYIHVDPTVGHAVKLLADEIFGPGCFQREIVWRIGWVSGFKTRARNWIRNHDLIFFYAKNPKRFTFNKMYVPHPEGYRRRDGSLPRGQGIPMEDVWNANESEFALRGTESLDSIQIKSFSTEKTGYATQKNESLLRRIVQASSNPGDLVADPFCGSGTTLAVAEQLGRRWLGCDTSRHAIHIARKRLLSVPDCARFRVSTLGPIERRSWARSLDPDLEWEAAYRGAVLDHHGARTGGIEEPFHGRRGQSAVHVAAPDRPMTSTELARLRSEGSEQGRARIHVLAGGWDLDVAPDAGENGVEVVLLQVQREIMDPRAAERRDAAIVERPELDVELDGLERGDVVVRLSGYGFAHPRRVPAELRKLVRQWSDYVDYWAVDWSREDGPFAPASHAFRTHQRRDLELALGPHTYRGRGPFELVVRIVDVLGNEVERWYSLARTGKRGLCVRARGAR